MELIPSRHSLATQGLMRRKRRTYRRKTYGTAQDRQEYSRFNLKKRKTESEKKKVQKTKTGKRTQKTNRHKSKTEIHKTDSSIQEATRTNRGEDMKEKYIRKTGVD